MIAYTLLKSLEKLYKENNKKEFLIEHAKLKNKILTDEYMLKSENEKNRLLESYATLCHKAEIKFNVVLLDRHYRQFSVLKDKYKEGK